MPPEEKVNLWKPVKALIFFHRLSSILIFNLLKSFPGSESRHHSAIWCPLHYNKPKGKLYCMCRWDVQLSSTNSSVRNTASIFHRCQKFWSMVLVRNQLIHSTSAAVNTSARFHQLAWYRVCRFHISTLSEEQKRHTADYSSFCWLVFLASKEKMWNQ